MIYLEDEFDWSNYNNENKNMTKSIWRSKTVWFNIIVAVVAILALPEFVAVLPEIWLKFAVLGGAIGNTVLRVFFTSTTIE